MNSSKISTNKKPPLSIRGVLSTNQFINSFDWLEFTAKAKTLDFTKKNSFLFTIEDTGKRTKQFNRLYCVKTFYNGIDKVFGHLEADCYVSYISRDLVKFKIDNEFLYSPNLKTVINHFLNDFDLTFKHFTRLDVCFDFQQTENFNPQDFLKRILNHELKLKSKTNFNAYFTKGQITGVTFGSYESSSRVVAYNKSLELDTKKDKPWIRSLWSNYFNDSPVYRIEVSLKPSKKRVIEYEGFSVNYLDDLNVLDLPRLVHYILKKILIFAISSPGVDFDRLEKYQLFEFENQLMNVSIINDKKVSTTIVKSYLKRLLSEAYSYQVTGNLINAHYTIELFQKSVNEYNLHKWVDLRLPFINVIQSQNMTTADLLNELAINTNQNLKQKKLQFL